MATVKFDFDTTNAWTMGPACGTPGTPSVNPAPVTNPCIYIIHNTVENSTYVGYADNAQHRWSTRYEVFHAMGIPKNYGNKILCAYCYPKLSAGQMFLEGQNNCEHLLIRAVVNGLLGVTTCTNTKLASTPFVNAAVTKILVYLPSYPAKWGKLEPDKQVVVNHGLY